jgi:flagellar assembly protein FliH
MNSLKPMMQDVNAAKKFDFRNSFDSNERGMVSARDFTLADLEKARAESFEKGKKEGAVEARASIEHATATALGAIGSRLGELRQDMDAVQQALETEALEAVLSIACKLVPHYAEAHGVSEIEGIVRECLTAVYDEPRVVIRAKDAILDHIKLRLDELIASSGFGGKIVLFADPTLGDTDCRIEWADGGTERDTKRLWQEIEDNITRFLGRLPGPADAESPAEETQNIQL